MKHAARALAIAATTVAVAAGTVAIESAIAPSADAATQHCPSGKSPKTSYAGAHDVAKPVSITLGYKIAIHLRVGERGGRQYEWAQVRGTFRRDAVWIDVSKDGGRSWAAGCGEQYNNGNEYDHVTINSQGFATSPSPKYVMRACGVINDARGHATSKPRCTSWA